MTAIKLRNCGKILKNKQNFGKRRISFGFTFEVEPFKLHLLDYGPSMHVTCTSIVAMQLYKQMSVIRRLELAANQLYKDKFIRGFCHLYSGQEACAVGIESVLRRSDVVICGYRVHAWSYTRGISAAAILCELTGRQRGCAKGKGGSMHMYSKNLYGGHGIVGAQVPLGAGIAFAQKYISSKNLTVAVYGDGAANQGQLFETFNIAKLWSLPIIFVCENNGFGMGTSAARASANPNYYTKSDVIPGIWINGMDVLAVREATTFAVDYVRKGNGPIILEAATYRYHGHSMSDPGTSYRKREEIQEVRKTSDPIARLEKRIIDAELLTSDELQNIKQEAKAEIEAATQLAKTDIEIPLEDRFADIYVNPIDPNIRGVSPFEIGSHKRISRPFNL